MRKIVWMLALWLGWQVVERARRPFRDTETGDDHSLQPLSPFPADPTAPRDA